MVFLKSLVGALPLCPTSEIFLALGILLWNRKDFLVVELAILLVLERLLAFLLLLLLVSSVYMSLINCVLMTDASSSCLDFWYTDMWHK